MKIITVKIRRSKPDFNKQMFLAAKVRWNPPPSQGGICNVSYFYTNMVTQLLNPQWEDSSKLCNRFHFSLQLSSKLTALGKWGFHQKSYQSQQLCFNHHCWFNGIAGDPTGSYYFIFHFSLVISIIFLPWEVFQFVVVGTQWKAPQWFHIAINVCNR